jgi:AhpD family alkylhydroperoxidase
VVKGGLLEEEKPMPVIEPVPMEHLDPELRDLIAAGRASGMLSTTVPNQVWAYRPELSKLMVRRYELIFHDGLIDARLRELLRLRVASFNDCQACKAARKADEVSEEDVARLAADHADFTPREQAALRFADLFVTDHFAIDDEVFRELGALFSKAEIIEITMIVAGHLGNQRMVHVLRAYDNDERPPVLRYDGEFAPTAARETLAV